MALTEITYTGDGTDVTFGPIPFPYLEESDVLITINGAATTAFTIDNSTKIITFSSAPANGSTIRVYRNTDNETLAATFISGSAIRAVDLNDNFTQNLYVIQEIDNNAVQTDGSTPFVGDVNMSGYKITNLATPTTDTDAANRAYVNSVVANGISDGDKGDITVSGFGSTLTIDNGVITNAKVNSGAGIVSSKLAFTQSGTGAEQRTVESKLQDVVSVLDFIPESEHAAIKAGTSTYDCTAKLQSAINAATGAVYIPAGRYKINSTVNLISNTAIYGEGYDSFLDGTGIPAGGPSTTNSNPIFKIPTPTNAYTLTLSSNISAGDRVVTVASTTSVNVGDLIAFANNVSYDYLNSNVEGDPGSQVEYLYVKSKTVTTITLSSRLSFDYSTGTATIFKPNYLNNVTISALRLETNGTFCPVVYGVGAVGLHLSDLYFDGNDKSYFVYAERILESSVKGCTVENTGQSAALSLSYHSARNIISGNIFRNHDLVDSGDSAIIVYYGGNNNTITSNVVVGTGPNAIYGITIHTKSWGNTVTGNTVSGMWAGIGAIFGSFRNTISSNAVSSCARGILLTNCRNFSVTNNSIFACSTLGQSTEGGVVLSGCFDTVVDSNVVDDCPEAGINIYQVKSERIVISNNAISNCKLGVVSDIDLDTAQISGNNIYKTNDAIGLYGTSANITVIDNVITNTTGTGRGIYAYIPGVNYNISHNRLKDIGTNGIGFGSGSSIEVGFVNDNIITDCGGYGISLTATNIASVRGNVISNATSGQIQNAVTSIPSSSLNAPAGYFVYNNPSDPSVPRTILGWRKKDSVTTGSAGWIQVNRSDADTSSNQYLAGTNTSYTLNSNISGLLFTGNTGIVGAGIRAVCDTDWASGSSPARLIFSTTPVGSNSTTDRLTIKRDGDFVAPDIYNRTSATGRSVLVQSGGLLVADTSSARYKTSIETVEDQYSDALLSLRPIWYKSTCEGDNPDWSYWGFIAEEVAEVDPRLVIWGTEEVIENEDGSRETVPLDEPVADGVAYDRFVPHLLNLIKRQKEQITSLETRLTDAGF